MSQQSLYYTLSGGGSDWILPALYMRKLLTVNQQGSTTKALPRTGNWLVHD